MKVIPFLIVYGTVPALLAGIYYGGWANLLAPLVAFLLVPMADAMTGHNLVNPSAEDEKKSRLKDFLFGLPLYVWVPLQVVIVIWAIIESLGRTGWDWFGLVFAVGLFTGGIGITIAHELMHRTKGFEKGLAEVLMQSVTYPHFCIEHVLGHHKHVATPKDAATARLGESVYRFYPRVVVDSVKSAVELERSRAKRVGIAAWSLKHRLTRYSLTLAGIYAVLALTTGWAGVLFFALQSFIAFTLLEVINYVEHYGLQRREKSPGKYERVQPHHSWNANHKVSGYWLFHLQRHADHHAYASRPYHLLRTTEEGPQLPYGYPTMLLMALVPPLWRRVMDPRVAALQGASGDEAGPSAHVLDEALPEGALS
jgi:alkane 1-monooxygenase